MIAIPRDDLLRQLRALGTDLGIQAADAIERAEKRAENAEELFLEAAKARSRRR